MRSTAIVAMLWAVAAGPALADPPQISGEVSRGDTFSATLCSGVVFALRPSPHGWTIWVGDPARPEENFAAVRTPPYRVSNALLIDGWHFRNRDNSGPNAPGPLNVNAPQYERSFRFVTTRTDYETARDALDVLLWPGNWGGDQIAAANAALEEIPDATGTLVLEFLELGNFVVGEQAWVERMAFMLFVENGCR